MWLSWQESGLLTLGLLGVLLALRSTALEGVRRPALLDAAARELALVGGLYTLWRFAASLHTATSGGAYDRARLLNGAERALHLPSELAAERFLLAHQTLATACNLWYRWSHGSVLAVVLVWLFLRHRRDYGRWRNALAGLTGVSLVLHFVPVAPPRLMPELGFVDQARVLGQSVYAPFGSGAFDQLAAMPSLHVGWALVAAGALWCSPTRWRWLGVAQATATFVVVAITAQHWWLDGVVAGLLLLAVLLLDDRARGVTAARAQPRPDVTATGGQPLSEVSSHSRT